MDHVFFSEFDAPVLQLKLKTCMGCVRLIFRFVACLLGKPLHTLLEALYSLVELVQSRSMIL